MSFDSAYLKDLLLPIFAHLICYSLYWLKSNSKNAFGFHWGPFEWWLAIGLITNYLGLWAWWRLVEISDVWRAGVICMVLSICVDLTFNSVFFNFNPKGAIALSLCALAAYIVHL